MEQYDRFRHRPERWERRARRRAACGANSGIAPGLVLVAVGALFFLNNLHIFYIREWLRFWPAILIAVGIVKLVDSTYSGGRVFGGVLAGFGAIFLARTLGYIDVTMREIWPLFLVGLGLLLLVQRTGEWHLHLPDQTGNPVAGPGALKIDAVFGGVKRVVTSQDFQGGEVVAVFGGVELDFRQAGMTGESAILEINAIFGGVEIRIPRNWRAEVHGHGIFGGYADNSVPPDPALGPVKLLIVRGTATFGGVDVKN